MWRLSRVYLWKQSESDGLPEPHEGGVGCGHWNQDNYNVNVCINVNHGDDNRVYYFLKIQLHTKYAGSHDNIHMSGLCHLVDWKSV